MDDCSWVIYKNENTLRTSWSSKVVAIWIRHTLPQNSFWGTVKYWLGKNTCLLVTVNWIWMKKKMTPRSISYFPVTDRAGRRKKKKSSNSSSNSFTLSITLCLKQLCRVTRQQSRWFISKTCNTSSAFYVASFWEYSRGISTGTMGKEANCSHKIEFFIHIF